MSFNNAMKNTGQKLLRELKLSSNASQIAAKMDKLCDAEPVYDNFQFQPPEFLLLQNPQGFGGGFNGTGDNAGKLIDLNLCLMKLGKELLIK